MPRGRKSLRQTKTTIRPDQGGQKKAERESLISSALHARQACHEISMNGLGGQDAELARGRPPKHKPAPLSPCRGVCELRFELAVTWEPRRDTLLVSGEVRRRKWERGNARRTAFDDNVTMACQQAAK